jgi:hypothetical protein
MPGGGEGLNLLTMAAEADDAVIPSPKYATWKNRSPTGVAVWEANPDATPPTQVHSGVKQTFKVIVAETHPDKDRASPSGLYSTRKAGLRFVEAESCMLIPGIMRNKLNTRKFEQINPGNYYVPHPPQEVASRLNGTILTAVDFVWVHDKSSAYDNMKAHDFEDRNSIIISIVPGMYVKREAEPNMRCAVVFPYRPFDGETREPRLFCYKMDGEDGESFKEGSNEPPISIAAHEIIEVGSNSNSANGVLNTLLKTEFHDLLLFFEHYPTDQRGWACTAEAQNKLTEVGAMQVAVKSMLREFRKKILADKTDSFGVRRAGEVVHYKEPADPEDGTAANAPQKYKDVPYKCTKEQESYDLFVYDTFLEVLHVLHAAYEYDFSLLNSAEEQ